VEEDEEVLEVVVTVVVDNTLPVDVVDVDVDADVVLTTGEPQVRDEW
jgi:hypothetical protein